MYSDKKRLYILAASLCSLLFLSFFITISIRRIVCSILLVGLCVLIVCLIKKRSILSLNKKQVTGIMAITGLLYLMMYYLPGIGYGFYRNLYALASNRFFTYIIPITLIIISFEMIRSVLLAQKNKIVNVILFISSILVELIIYVNYAKFTSFEPFMDMIGLTLFPSLGFNLLYTYLSKRYGMWPNVVFRLLITLYLYFIPFVPKTPEVMVSFVKLVIPFVIYIFVNTLYEKKKTSISRTKKRTSNIMVTFFSILMIGLVMLVSCQFKYGMLVIATESMTGSINKGDAVVYEEYDNQIIEEGDVLVFNVNDSIIVHRCVKIERINNEIRYYTKGDANEEIDFNYIVNSQIVGIVKFRIVYIGYPSLWVRSIFD